MAVEINTAYPRIELVACAKNEAAYLPEWIFYHLKLGFSSIKIYINNTDDLSVAVLDKIIQQQPEVSYIIADDLIKNPPNNYKGITNSSFFDRNRVQAVAYADALSHNISSSDFTAFLDIDEFFYPFKPLNKIFSTAEAQTCATRFKWLLLSGDETEFSSLASCSKGYMDDQFKSVVPRVNNILKTEDEHSISINGNIGHLSSDAVILHRVLRSKSEYLYLLARSTSNSKDKLANGFKQNRRGWTSRGINITKFKVNFDYDYKKNLQDFFYNCEITELVDTSRKTVMEKSTLIKESLINIRQQNIDLTRSLSGLGISHINFTKTLSMLLFWRALNLLFPRLVLSHETIKESVLSMLKFQKK